jgi:hypothetical protein
MALSVTGAANGLTRRAVDPSTTGTTDHADAHRVRDSDRRRANATIKGTAAGLADQTVTVQPSITAQTSSGNVTWQFCGRLGIPIWVAFQDGTSGAWTHVTGTNDSYTFNITQAVGGVAYVLPFSTGGFDLEVFYGSKADLQGAPTRCAAVRPARARKSPAVAGTSAGDFVLGASARPPACSARHR